MCSGEGGPDGFVDRLSSGGDDAVDSPRGRPTGRRADTRVDSIFAPWRRIWSTEMRELLVILFVVLVVIGIRFYSRRQG